MLKILNAYEVRRVAGGKRGTHTQGLMIILGLGDDDALAGGYAAPQCLEGAPKLGQISARNMPVNLPWPKASLTCHNFSIGIRKPLDIKPVYTFAVRNAPRVIGLIATTMRSRLVLALLILCPACLIHRSLSSLACPVEDPSNARQASVEDGWTLFHPIQGFLISQIRRVVAERFNNPFADGLPESRVLPIW